MEGSGDSGVLSRILSILETEDALRSTSQVPVVNFLHPSALKKEIDLELGPPSGEPLEAICEKVLKYSVKTSHPHFYNQLYGGVDVYGLAGAWISECLNTNQHTFEVAPVFTLTEKAVIDHVCKKVGFGGGDGIFSPGGSISNMYSLAMARYKLFPEVKVKGLRGLPCLVAFTSEDSHYSLDKAVHWLGLGIENLIKIESDAEGRMKPQALEEKIKQTLAQGKTPFFVNATAGTTIFGSIDPLEQVSDICERYRIWMHVDACYGGTLLLSKSYSGRLRGIHRADSVSWNAHKMLGAPLQCSIFLTRHEGLMQECNSASAAYLFQQDKFYDVSYDTGDKSIQCGRKIDGFKLWFMWKIRGDDGLERLIDNAMDCATYFKNAIQKREGFRLVVDHFDVANVCFWYIPGKMRGLPENEKWWELLGKVAPAIKEQMTKKGVLMIGYTPLVSKGFCNFFRIVLTCHAPQTHGDMDFVINKIEEFGENL